MANIKLSKKDYDYCLKKLDELRDLFDRVRDPQVKIGVEHYSSILRNAEVADLSSFKNSHVLIGDMVTIAIDTGFGEDDAESYKLTLDQFDSFSDNISLKCPLGEAIYLKPVGSVCKYEVNDRKFAVRIVSKENSVEEETGSENV